MAWHWSRGKPQPVGTRWDKQPEEQPDFRLEALYAWERRCRGYEFFGEPVALEPRFAPYIPNLPLHQSGWDQIPQPRHQDPGEVVAFSVLLPAREKVTAVQTDALFSAWRGLREPIALEIVATHRRITYQIAASAEAAPIAAGAFTSPIPQARLEAREDALFEALRPHMDLPFSHRVVDWGLYHPAYHPLRLWDSLAATPHNTLLSQLGSLREGQIAGLQILIEPALAPWGDSLADLVAQFDRGPSAHPGTRDTYIERALRYKLASPLWAVAVRIFGFVAGDSEDAVPAQLKEIAFDLCRRIGDNLDVLGTSDEHGLQTNELMALDDSGYPDSEHLRDVLRRRSRRTGMLLSQFELLGLWHPPTAQMNHPKLSRYDPSIRELPDELRQARGPYLGALTLPENSAAPEPVLVPWPDTFRNRHAYLLGATRMGKSTLFLNLIVQDLMDGRGLCLIDPHGDLAQDVLDRIPPERKEDVLFLDLSDTAYPPAIGLLETQDEWEERLLVSDLLAILHRLFRASWGDRLEHILRHALLTLLADTEKHTLRDIRPLLANKPYREMVLKRLPDADLRAFWNSEYQSYSSTAFAPIYNKLGLLMSSPTVRNIISGKESKLHPGEVIQNKRILIVNLAQSLIGEDNAHFLGALLVSKIQLAAMHNLRRGRGERTEFTLYVDEFQNFVVSSFEKILSEAGKAGLSLVMANQFLEQLSEGLQTAILSNTGTLVSFRVSAESGRRLESEFGGFYGAKELTDLERGRAVVRLGRARDSYAIRTFPPVDPEVLNAETGARDGIIDRTRQEVCRPRREVEAEFRADEEALEELLRQAEEEEQRAKAKPAGGRAAGTSSRPAAKDRAATDTHPEPESGPQTHDSSPRQPHGTGPRDTHAAESGGTSESSHRAPEPPKREASRQTHDAPKPPPTEATRGFVEGTEHSNQPEEGHSAVRSPGATAGEEPPSPSGPAFFGLAEDEFPPDAKEGA